MKKDPVSLNESEKPNRNHCTETTQMASVTTNIMDRVCLGLARPP